MQHGPRNARAVPADFVRRAFENAPPLRNFSLTRRDSSRQSAVASRSFGLAGGAARLMVLENTRFEVQFEATLWGTIKELREVIALAESGQLSSIPIETTPLEQINEVYARLKRGEIRDARSSSRRPERGIVVASGVDTERV
jgi:hypothetical protein